MTSTTIKLDKKTKKELDKLREYKNESYDELIRKLIHIIRASKEDDEGDLTQEALDRIEKARERMKKGEFVTLEEAKKRFGMDVQDNDK